MLPSTMDIALTRGVSPSIDRCELTHIGREPIDLARAVAQHEDYCDRLEALGLEVLRLPADAACPDCCFVEDTAIVLDEVAILTPLGAAARRAESPIIEAELSRYRTVRRIELPATIEGGDVMPIGRRIFVGLSTRTSAAGIEALRAIAGPFGYEVIPVSVTGCLHLKSAVTALDDETVLANPGWFDSSPLAGLRIVGVAGSEPGAANVLAVRGQIWAHPGFPRTIEVLEGRGYRITPVDISEFLKAEAALTCKSVLFRRSAA
jgi:dimethylargininase